MNFCNNGCGCRNYSPCCANPFVIVYCPGTISRVVVPTTPTVTV